MVQFYGDEEIFLDTWTEIIANAVENGDASICFATEVHRDQLSSRLKWRGINMSAATNAGYYLPLDATETLKSITQGDNSATELFSTTVERASLSVAESGGQVIVAGEVVSQLWSTAKCEEAVELEKVWTRLQQHHKVTVHHAYPLRVFEEHRNENCFAQVCEEHSVVFWPPGLPISITERDSAYPDLSQFMKRAQHQARGGYQYPKWQREYRSVLLETRREKIFTKLEIAEAGVLTRLQELEPTEIEERQQLMEARARLQAVKRQKLGFID
jgi:hypothetical protein